MAQGYLIDIKINGQSVTTANRKLKVTWTMEAAEDLRTVHNLDIGEQVLRAIFTHEAVDPIVQFESFEGYEIYGQPILERTYQPPRSNLNHCPDEIVSWQEEGF